MNDMQEFFRRELRSIDKNHVDNLRSRLWASLPLFILLLIADLLVMRSTPRPIAPWILVVITTGYILSVLGEYLEYKKEKVSLERKLREDALEQVRNTPKN